MSLLSVDDLTVRFGSTVGVRSVSVEVEAGEIAGILGANGAGKTTTLLGIHARVPRVGGRRALRREGCDLAQHRPTGTAGIALCPENRRLFPNMSIEDNLLLGAYGNSRAVQQERLAASYERFQWIGERRSELAGRLSGGQQQIVAIARALMSNPKVVLLDEPSSGLAPVAIEEIRALLEHVAASGTAVLLVEQNVKLVQSLCQRAWVLAHGTVKDAGAVAELLEGARVADAYLGGLDLLEDDEPTTDDHAPPRYEEVPT